MKYRDRFTKPRIVAFAFASLLPFAAMILGIISLMGGLIFNALYWIPFVVLPLIFMGLLYLLMFSKMGIWGRSVLSILLLLAFVYLFVFACVLCATEWMDIYRNDDVIEPYEELKKEFVHMPELTDLGDTQELEYYDYVFAGIFRTDSDVLICQYDKPEYEKQKAQVFEQYVFQSETMTYIYASRGCEPFAEVDGYSFRTLSVGGEYGDELYYPKRLIFIATNDETCEIVYMACCDMDLDCIRCLPEFIKNDCGWKYMR